MNSATDRHAAHNATPSANSRDGGTGFPDQRRKDGLTLRHRGPNGLVIEAQNPDQRLCNDFADRIRECVQRELAEFCEECRVAMRQLKPGETKVIQSRPITIEISMGTPDAAAAADPLPGL